MESPLGLMEDHMKENISMTRSMDLGHLFGRMVVNMLGNGKMANNMEKDSIFCQVGNQRQESGVKERN